MQFPLNKEQVLKAYHKSNDGNNGYHPYCDMTDDDSIEAAVQAAIDDDAEVVERYDNPTMVILKMYDGGLIAITDENGAWAVPLD
jgi:hypothetical protein